MTEDVQLIDAPLVERAVCSQDVQDIIGELIAALNTIHIYSYGGDNRLQAETVNEGMLGAD